MATAQQQHKKPEGRGERKRQTDRGNRCEMSSNSQNDKRRNYLIVPQIQVSIETFGLIPYYSNCTIKGRFNLPKNFKCRHSGQEENVEKCVLK